MGKGSVFGRAVESLFAAMGKRKLNRFDSGVLVAMLMLSAVDGEISKSELDRAQELMKRCEGGSDSSFAKAWDAALHSAGYILIQARLLPREDLVAAFVREAERPFVAEAAQEATEDRDRAFQFLESVAAADGDYSEVERACIQALVGRVKEARDKALAERFSRASVYNN